jgi:hypothetical protein
MQKALDAFIKVYNFNKYVNEVSADWAGLLKQAGFVSFAAVKKLEACQPVRQRRTFRILSLFISIHSSARTRASGSRNNSRPWDCAAARQA